MNRTLMGWRAAWLAGGSSMPPANMPHGRFECPGGETKSAARPSQEF